MLFSVDHLSMVLNHEYTLTLPGGFTDHVHFLGAPFTVRTVPDAVNIEGAPFIHLATYLPQGVKAALAPTFVAGVYTLTWSGDGIPDLAGNVAVDLVDIQYLMG